MKSSQILQCVIMILLAVAVYLNENPQSDLIVYLLIVNIFIHNITPKQ